MWGFHTLLSFLHLEKTTQEHFTCKRAVITEEFPVGGMEMISSIVTHPPPFLPPLCPFLLPSALISLSRNTDAGLKVRGTETFI